MQAAQVGHWVEGALISAWLWVIVAETGSNASTLGRNNEKLLLYGETLYDYSFQFWRTTEIFKICRLKFTFIPSYCSNFRFAVRRIFVLGSKASARGSLQYRRFQNELDISPMIVFWKRLAIDLQLVLRIERYCTMGVAGSSAGKVWHQPRNDGLSRNCKFNINKNLCWQKIPANIPGLKFVMASEIL